MKKTIALIASLALMLALVAGCASPAAEPAEPAAPEATAAPVETAAPEDTGAYTAGVYTGTGTGMGGDFTVSVTFTADAITDIVVGENAETAGIGDNAIAVLPGRIIEAQSIGIDAVSGATITSNAIFDAVADAATQAGGDVEALKAAPEKAPEAEGDAVAEYTADVVVVGAGGSGLFGALEAARAGASVMVIEKSANCLSSNSNQIGGTAGIESRLLKELGETYTADDLFDRMVEYSHWTVNAPLLRALVNMSGSTIDLMEDLGVEFTAGADRFSTGFLDVHSYVTQNKMQLLEQDIIANGGQFFYETTGYELIMQDGVCVGVMAKNADGNVRFNAKAVLVATGGFLGNAEMMREVFGEANVHVMTGSTTCTGDGINMVIAAGGLRGRNFALSLNDLGGTNAKSACMSNLGQYIMDRNQALTFGLGCGLLVDVNGERFFNEYKIANDPLAGGGEALLHAGGYYYAVLDEATVAASSEMGYYKAIGSPAMWTDAIVNEGSPVIMHNTPLPRLYDDIDAGIAEGWIFKADTIDELQEATGLAGLSKTVESYNAMCAEGYDSEFLKDPAMLRALGEGPYYVIQYQPGSWCTMGGVVTDRHLRAVTPAYTPILGLYVAGGDNSSIYSSPYYDVGGTSSGMAFNSGRLAGIEMASYVKGN